MTIKRRAMLITHRVVLAKRVMRATMPRTLGAFSICTEMSGSGPRTGTGNLSQRQPGGGSHRCGFGLDSGHRGGSWTATGRACVLLSAHTTPPSIRYDSFGFRVGFQTAVVREQ